jgi:Nucleotide-diphospho-sugar transferase
MRSRNSTDPTISPSMLRRQQQQQHFRAPHRLQFSLSLFVILVVLAGYNFYIFLQNDVHPKAANATVSSQEEVNVKDDDVSSLQWPPTEMMEALLAEATLSSSTRTPQGVPRLIVCASNADYVDFVDNFVNSLLALNVTNFVVVPLDRKAHDILKQAYPKHTLPMLPGLENHPDGTASFGDEAFKMITSTRPTFLLPFLRKGYAILYNDIDIVWQHNAWDVIDERDADNNLERILWKDAEPQICSCMMYLLPTLESISLLKEWEKEMQSEEQKHKIGDQNAFIVVASRLNYPFEGGTIGTTRVYNNDEQFPAGNQYSWHERLPVNDKAVIIHNNFIVSKKSKKNRFEEAGLWKPSGRIVASSIDI